MKKLNNDNDRLTSQLKMANSAISTLTEEKRRTLSELEGCSNKYNCISRDFETITTEVTITRTKLQKFADENEKCQTQLIATNADSQKWKTKSESFEIELKKSKEINVQLTVTINEYTTKITNFQTTINEITIKSNKCGSESDEWKRKYESELAKTAKYEKNIKDLEANNADLKKKYAEKTEELSCCQNQNHHQSIEISTLKTSVDDFKKVVSKHTVDMEKCDIALKLVTDEYNADEIRDHDEMLIRKSLEIDLCECRSRKDEIEKSYQSEKTLVINCKNEIVHIREEQTKISKIYEADIANLKITFKASLDKCEFSLNVEKATNVKISIDIKNLQNQIVQIKNELSISIEVFMTM